MRDMPFDRKSAEAQVGCRYVIEKYATYKKYALRRHFPSSLRFQHSPTSQSLNRFIAGSMLPPAKYAKYGSPGKFK
jgi:hypothetical protein